MGLILSHPCLVQFDEISRVVRKQDAIVSYSSRENVRITDVSQIGFTYSQYVMLGISQLLDEQFCLGALIYKQPDGQCSLLFLATDALLRPLPFAANPY